MNNVMNAAKLDLSLLKPYIKTMCLVLLAPITFTVTSRSIISGIVFTMAILSATSSYTFSVAEKNGMERLYGILPVAKKQLVYGKYICVVLVGLVALLGSLIVHIGLLMALSAPVSLNEILVSVIIGLSAFMVIIAFQIPIYYKYGTIKGRMSMFFLVAGITALATILQGLNLADAPVVVAILDNPVLFALIITAVLAAMMAVSISISIKIMKKKDL